MRQKFSLKKKFGIHYTFIFCVGLGCTSFCDVVKSIFLSLDHFGEFKTWSECLFHLCVIWTIETDSVEDVFVTQTIKGTE
jgi:hypothetical protein